MRLIRNTKDGMNFILYSDATINRKICGIPRFEMSVFAANKRFAFSLAHGSNIGFLVIAFGKGFSIVYRR